MEVMDAISKVHEDEPSAIKLVMAIVPEQPPAMVGICYVVQEPLGEMPEVVCVAGRKRGIQVLENSTCQTLTFLPWDAVLEWKPQMQSDDPEDMELLSIEVKDLGLFVFECDDANEIANLIDAA